jgi:hypothetical protein
VMPLRLHKSAPPEADGEADGERLNKVPPQRGDVQHFSGPHAHVQERQVGEVRKPGQVWMLHVYLAAVGGQPCFVWVQVRGCGWRVQAHVLLTHHLCEQVVMGVCVQWRHLPLHMMVSSGQKNGSWPPWGITLTHPPTHKHMPARTHAGARMRPRTHTHSLKLRGSKLLQPDTQCKRNLTILVTNLALTGNPPGRVAAMSARTPICEVCLCAHSRALKTKRMEQGGTERGGEGGEGRWMEYLGRMAIWRRDTKGPMHFHDTSTEARDVMVYPKLIHAQPFLCNLGSQSCHGQSYPASHTLSDAQDAAAQSQHFRFLVWQTAGEMEDKTGRGSTVPAGPNQALTASRCPWPRTQ